MRRVALLALPLLGACAGTDASAPRFTAQVLLETGTKLGGCAIGDLDPAHAGNEIAVVASDGSVLVLHRVDGRWEHERAADFEGEMIQCAVGDADPAHAGLELVAVGMKSGGEDSGGEGAAHVVRKGERGWQSELVTHDAALIHGVAIGDVVPERAGDEVVTVGYGGRARVFGRGADGWQELGSAPLESNAKTAVVWGGGVAIACTDGTIRMLEHENGAWTTRVIDRAQGGQARISSGGGRLIVARDDGALALVEDGTHTDVHVESDKLRGAVLADLDPAAEGLEAATAGYGAAVTVLHPEGKSWRARTVYTDTDRFHHLAAGDLGAPDGAASLVAVGYSGRVILIEIAER